MTRDNERHFPEAFVPPTAAVTADRTAVRLSDTLTVTLTVEGPSPLQVELSKTLLTDEAAPLWKIELVGGATVRTDPAGDHWQQVFRLSPFVPGEAVPLAFRPVRVSGAEVPLDPLNIKVETVITTAKVDDARPVTEIEQLPPSSAEPFTAGPVIAVGVTTAFAAAVAFSVIRHRRKPKPVSADEWVRRRLAELDPNSGVKYADGIADAVRGYLARRFHLTADPYTTPELLAAGDTAGAWAADTRAAVAEILGTCDRVKFAGRMPTADECRVLGEQTRALIDGWE